MARIINPYGVNAYKKGSPVWPVNNYNIIDPRGVGIRSNESPEAVQGYTFNYNDPLEINSLADVFFNEAGLDKYEGGALEKRVRAFADLVYRGTIKPIWKEGFKAIVNPDAQWWLGSATINALVNFGETLSVLGNPIKGMLMEKEGPLKGLERSIGYGDEGRYNYDFDYKPTGIKGVDWTLNMAGEIVTDPFNWVSLGVGAVSKTAATELKSGASVLIKEAAEETGEKFLKQAMKEASDLAAKSLAEFAPKVAPKLIPDAVQARVTKTFVDSLVDNSNDIAGALVKTRRVASKLLPDQVFASSFIDALESKVTKEVMTSMLDTAAFKTLRQLQAANKVSHAIEGGVVKATAWSTGLPVPGLALKGAKYLLDKNIKNPALDKIKRGLFKADALETYEGTARLAYNERALARRAKAQELAAKLQENPTTFKKTRDVAYDSGLFKDLLDKHASEARTAKEVFDNTISDPKFRMKEEKLFFSKDIKTMLTRKSESLSGYIKYYFPTEFTKKSLSYSNADLFLKDTMEQASRALADLIDSPTSVSAMDALYYLEQLTDPDLKLPFSLTEPILEISNELEKRITKQAIDASRNVRGYNFKLSQAQVAMDMLHALNDSVLERGMLKIVNGDSVFLKRLQELADLSTLFKTKKGLAQEIIKKVERNGVLLAEEGTRSAILDSFIRHMQLTAYGHFDYKWLSTQLLENDTIKPLFNNIFDTLQFYSRDKLEWYAGNKEYNIRKIIHKLEEQRVTYSQAERYSLENLVTGLAAKYKEECPKWIKDTFGDVGALKAHDAGTDAMSTAFLIYSEEGPLKHLRGSIETDKTFGIVVDIETYGFNSSTDPIAQIHLTVPGLGKSYDIKAWAQDGVYPSDDALKAISGGMELTEAKKWFDDTYRRTALPTEEAALQLFSQTILDIEQHLQPGKRAVIIGHNIDDFDTAFIKARMTTYNLADAYKIFTDKQTVDTLFELKKNNGLAVLTKAQKDNLSEILSEYIDMRVSSGALIDEGKFMSSEALFINTIDGAFLDEFNQVRHALLDVDQSIPYMQALNEQMYRYAKSLEEVRDVLRTTGEVNRELAKLRMYYDYDQKCFLDADLNATTFGSAQFSTQLFLLDDAVYLDNNIKALIPFAPRIVMDTQTTRRFFRDDVLRAEGFSNVQRFTILKEISYKLNKYASHFKPFRFVDEKSISAFRTIQKTFMELIGDGDPFIKQLKLDATYVPDQYALARYMYERARKIYNKLDNDVDERIVTHRVEVNSEKGGKLGLVKTSSSSKKVTQMPGVAYKFEQTKIPARAPGPTRFQKTISELEKDEQVLSVLDYIRYPEREISTGFIKSPPEDLYASFYFPHIGEGWARTIDIDDDLYRARMNLPLSEWLDQTDMALGKSDLLDAHVRAETEVLRDFYESYKTYEKFVLGLDDSDKGLLKEGLTRYADAKALTELDQLISLSPEDLQKHMWQRSFGVLTFAKDPKNAAYNEFIDEFIEQFKAGKDAYEAAHINFYYDELEARTWIYLDRAEDLVGQYKQQAAYKGTLVDYTPAESVFDYSKYAKYENVFKTAEELTLKLSRVSRGVSVGSMGNYISVNNLNEIYAAVPKVIKDRLIDITEFTAKETSHFKFMNFNRTNIGSMASRKMLEPYIAYNPIKNHLKAAQDLVHRLDTRFKIQHLMMDTSLFSLNSGFPSKLGNDELLELVKNNPSFQIAVLEMTDEPGLFGYKIKPIIIRNAADVDYARAAGAVLLDPQTYLEAVRYINTFQITNPIMRFMDKYIVGLQKTGYLSTIGWPLRNFFDSMEKNLIHGGPTMLMHTFETARNYFKYQKVCRSLADALKADGKPYGFSMDALNKLYEKEAQAIPKEVFLMYHNFLQQGAMVGLTTASRKEMTKYAAKRKAGLIDQSSVEKAVDSVYDAIYGNPWSTRIYDVNEAIEHIMRISNYTWDIYQGKTSWSAMQSVIKNHFDYTTKTKAMMHAEVFMPFLSFKLNNIVYWLETFNDNPQLAFILRDLYTPVMDLNERDQLEVRQNRSLQYHIFAGNIVLDNNTTIKITPSMSEALQALYDPDVFFKSVTPVVRLPIEAILQIAKQNRFNKKLDLEGFGTDLMDSVPLLGPLIQKYRIDPRDVKSVVLDQKVTEKDPFIDLGAAWTAYTRISDASRWVALAFPSVFGGVKKQYYFVYAGTGILFKTYDKDKLMANLNKGAIQVGDPREYQLVYSTPRQKRTYPPKIKKNYVKKVYPRKVYFKKYTGRGYTPKYNASVQAKVLRSVRGTKMRMPYARSNSIHLATSVYKKIYTSGGADRFHSRLVPVNTKNILWKLKESWSYLR